MTDEAVIAHPDALWSARSIARFYDYSANYVANEIVCKPDFPRPRYPLGPGSHPRWRAGDVMEWFRGERKKSA